MLKVHQLFGSFLLCDDSWPHLVAGPGLLCGSSFSAWVSLTKSALAWGPLSGSGLWDEKLTVAQVSWASSPAMAARDGLSPAGVEVTH